MKWSSASFSAPPHEDEQITGTTLLDGMTRCDWWASLSEPDAVKECVCTPWGVDDFPVFPWPSMKGGTLNISEVECPFDKSGGMCEQWRVPLGNHTYWWWYKPSLVFSNRHFHITLSEVTAKNFTSETFNVPLQCVHMPKAAISQPAAVPVFPAIADGQCTPKIAVAGTHTYGCYGKQFTLAVPNPCVQGGCGLIVDTHGWAMDGDMEDKNSNLRAAAGDLGFLVLQGTAGPGVAPNTSWSTAQDAKDILRLVAELRDTYRLDAERLHACGFSQGGVMTWQLYCDAPDLWASIAPIAAGSPCFRAGVPITRLPVLYTHGRHDALVNFASGELTIKSLLKAWDITAEPEVVASSANFNHSRYRGDGRAVVETLWHEYYNLPVGSDPLNNWGHCLVGTADLPGSPLLFGQVRHFGCPYIGEADFVTFDEVLAFFLKHPKKETGVLV